jgi:hypothetical protein
MRLDNGSYENDVIESGLKYSGIKQGVGSAAGEDHENSQYCKI